MVVTKPIKTTTKQLVNLFVDFTENEESSGIVLIFCTVASLAIANSPFGTWYHELWHTRLLHHSLQHWVNDGLMAVFFLLVGLEIERELYIGELSDPRNATLPIAAAIGGMATPALVHFLLNRSSNTVGGAGIPMATDIAFALGVLALVGKRVPLPLKVFLTALAIIDDLGAILVIGLFYVADFSLPYLAAALAIFGLLILLNRMGITRLTAYMVLGLGMWYCMLKSGVHATIAGVLLAFAIPFGHGDCESPSYKLQHFLHKPAAFGIMPIFALANTGILLHGQWLEWIAAPNSLGIIAGLLVGKPVGITLFSYLAVKVGLAQLPGGVHWKQIVGIGFLGGIGFTMSIFITLLAFADSDATIQSSKICILLASVVAGTVGYLILRRSPASFGEPESAHHR